MMAITIDRIAVAASIIVSMAAVGLEFRQLSYSFLARPSRSFISISHAEKYNIFIETVCDGI